MKISTRKRRHETAGDPAQAGFSLAELMVVIVIIGLIATLVVPNVVGRLFVAQEGKAKIDLNSIKDALDQFAIENGGVYPDTLQQLVDKDENGNSYLDKKDVPRDPWDNEYQYRAPDPGEKNFELFSMGKDGEIGGEGEGEDIHYDDE